jgi:hypothetical protein
MPTGLLGLVHARHQDHKEGEASIITAIRIPKLPISFRPCGGSHSFEVEWGCLRFFRVNCGFKGFSEIGNVLYWAWSTHTKRLTAFETIRRF